MDGSAGDDGQSGSESAPLRSIQTASDRATDGQTIVVRAGVYHETVYVNRPLTIQNAAGEAVWLDGSQPVTDWQQDGDLWRASLPAVLDRALGPDDGNPYISREFPAAGEPELLFRDGRRLRQVLDRGEVGADTFMVDRRRKLMFTGADPGGAQWHTASLGQAIVVSAPDVMIRGIGVRRYGNSVRTQGAVYLARHGNVIENVVVEDVATIAVSFYSDENRGTGEARNVTIRRAGLMGIGGSLADGLRIRSTLIEGANFERFNPTPNSAGIKVTSSRDVVIEANVIRHSLGTTGIWLDESVVGFGIYGNQVSDNGDTGISAELSSFGAIEGNLVENHHFGVVLYSAGDIDISRNRILGNQVIDLDLRQDHRRQSDPGANGHDPRFAPGDRTNPWLVQNVHIECNTLGPGPAQARLRAVDTHTGVAADDMSITVDSTTFVSQEGTITARWGTGPPDRTRDITDPAQLPGSGSNLAVAPATGNGPACDPGGVPSR